MAQDFYSPDMNLQEETFLVRRCDSRICLKQGDALKQGNASGEDALELGVGGWVEVGIGFALDPGQSVSEQLQIILARLLVFVIQGQDPSCRFEYVPSIRHCV
jgi:hypothetical protein